MTQRDFIDRIAAETGVPKLRVDQILDLFLVNAPTVSSIKAEKFQITDI